MSWREMMAAQARLGAREVEGSGQTVKVEPTGLAERLDVGARESRLQVTLRLRA